MTTNTIDIPETIELVLTHEYGTAVRIADIDISNDIEVDTTVEVEVNGDSTTIDTQVEINAYDMEEALNDEVHSVTFNVEPAEFLAIFLREVRTEIDKERGMKSYHELKKAGKKLDKPLEELNPIDDKTFSAVVAKMLAPVVKVAPKIGVEEDDSFTPAPDEYY